MLVLRAINRQHFCYFSAYFIAGPVLLAVVFSFGFFVVNYQSDPAYLYTAQNSQAFIDQDIQEKHFPQNYSDFDPSRINLYGKYGRLIIQVRIIWNRAILSFLLYSRICNRLQIMAPYFERKCSTRLCMLTNLWKAWNFGTMIREEITHMRMYVLVSEMGSAMIIMS